MAGHAVKATIIDVIVALFITVFILLSVYLLFGARIDETISLINKVSIDLENKEIKETVLSENKIQNYQAGSYFPGEGGSIVYMGHNSKKMFRRFSELQIGDKIKVTTSYGEYNYKIYDMKLIKETEVDKLPIQKDKEILMVYTCYPFNNVGYATQRYVVYANLEK